MKYFTNELWNLGNNEDKDVREKANKEWLQRDQEYSAYFESIKDKLPKGYLKTYLSTNGFHDYSITEIQIRNGSPHGYATIEISLKDGKNEYLLTYRKVVAYNMMVPNERPRFDYMAWGYDEIELNKDGTFTNRIICDQSYEFEIQFCRIGVKKI